MSRLGRRGKHDEGHRMKKLDESISSASSSSEGTALGMERSLSQKQLIREKKNMDKAQR